MKIKKYIILPAIFISLAGCCQKRTENSDIVQKDLSQSIDFTDMTNNFYDNTETYPLIVKELTIEGEISNPGKADFSVLPVHSVIVKETLLDDSGSDKFTGAFRYDGYSLFDILDGRVPQKINASEFNSIIDLFIEIENEAGEKVVFSWGEIYYPNNLHKIIIAKSVSRIIPSKTKDLWELPEESRIVAGCDLITERNISSPVKITVRSYPRSFNVTRGMNPIHSDRFRVFLSGNPGAEICEIPEGYNDVTFSTVFYGRGRGIHSTQPFKGTMLKDLLAEYFPADRNSLRKGLICIAGKDGYRCTVSYSEIFNRNDQQEFLLVQTEPGENGGRYRLFAASDFFSDRAVKSISEIHLEQ